MINLLPQGCLDSFEVGNGKIIKNQTFSKIKKCRVLPNGCLCYPMQINGTFLIAPISYGLRKHNISLLIICKVRSFSNIIRPLNQGDHKHQSSFCSVPTE